MGCKRCVTVHDFSRGGNISPFFSRFNGLPEKDVPFFLLESPVYPSQKKRTHHTCVRFLYIYGVIAQICPTETDGYVLHPEYAFRPTAGQRTEA